MNSIVEAISAYWKQAASYIKELVLLLYYGAIEWCRVEGSALWANVQTRLSEMGIPVWVVSLGVAIFLLVILGLLIKLFRRRPKPVTSPKEEPRPPEKVTTPPAVTTPVPEFVSEIPGTTTSEPETVPEKPAVTTTASPAIIEPETVTTTPPSEPTPAPVKKISFFDRLKKGLNKTRQWLSDDLNAIFQLGKLDDETLEDLEETLITADIGVQTSMSIVEQVAKQKTRIKSGDDLKAVLQETVLGILTDADDPSKTETLAETGQTRPHVIMVVGVNGVGKTTTIGKLAAHYTAKGQKVLLAAADTFRAAAVEQLTIWAERSNADIVKHKDGSDPAAVAFDSVDAAIARDADVVLVDTAGRLHTKVNLMEEIKKVQRSINKRLPEAPQEILLVLDATTGQNGLTQAKKFNEALGLTGLVLTKLDGTAKGGVVIAICDTLNVPLQYIGVGEQIDDLQQFDSHQFVQALFS